MIRALQGAVPSPERPGIAVSYENPRARVLGAPFVVFMGVLSLVPAADGSVPGLARALCLVMGVAVVTVGVRMCKNFSVAVAGDILDVRTSFRRRRIPCSEVAGCAPRRGSEGLIYVRVYPVVELKDGSTVVVNSIQWPPADLAPAEAACQQLLIACHLRPLPGRPNGSGPVAGQTSRISPSERLVGRRDLPGTLGTY